MEQGKRQSIRKRILFMVVMISAMSLVVTSLFGIISMIQIQHEAKSALSQQAKDNLAALLSSKARQADLRMNKFVEIVSETAYGINDIISHPDEYSPRPVEPVNPLNAGKLVMQPAVRSEDMKWEDVKPQFELLANMETKLYPVITNNRRVITTVYYALENGLMMCYDDQSDNKGGPGLGVYDFTQSLWYKLGKEKQEITFTNVYNDNFGRGITITCVAPLYEKDGSFCGVLGIDLLINDLYSEILDIDLGTGASMFILGANGNVISLDPKMISEGTDAAGYNLSDTDKERMSSFSDGITVRNDMYYAFNTIESVGWKMCARVPQSNVLEFANTIGQNIVSSIIMFIVFFLIILLSVVILAYEFSGKLTKPITDLTEDVRKISGDLDYRSSVNSNDEIGDLARQFNEMAESLKERIEELTSITAEKERLRAELDIAAKIQESTLPKDFPDSSDFGIYATMTPAKEVGGDFYDFFTIDSDHFALVMADVSGKGIPAALFMTIAKSTIHNSVMNGGNTGSIMTRVNEILNVNNNSGFFVTVWLGIITISTGELQFSSAGHEYPAIRHANGKYELYVTDNLPALAVQEDIQYDYQSIMLEPGSSIFLYTDGVPDAKGENGERFGTARMLEVLNSVASGNMKREISMLRSKISEFTGDSEPFDDITMLGFSRG